MLANSADHPTTHPYAMTQRRMEFLRACDDLCYAPELWPTHMRDMHHKIQTAIKRYYGRWDFDPAEACLFTIDLWKTATGNVSVESAEAFVISLKGKPTKKRAHSFISQAK